jgi:hypothetical protein
MKRQPLGRPGKRYAKELSESFRVDKRGVLIRPGLGEDSDKNGPERALERYRPFPVEALPDPVRSFVVENARAIGCDDAYVALPLLASLAAAIGNTRRIELKRGWREPAVIWTAAVGDSGTLKSPAHEAGTRPLVSRQTEAFRRYREERDDFEREKLGFDVALAAWKASGAKKGEPPPKKPQEPVPTRYVISDVTVEAVAQILERQPRGVLLSLDELSGWLGSFDRYAAARGGDVAHWLSMHRASPITVDRKTAKQLTHIPHAAVSVTGGVQPVALQRALGTVHFENGLAARLLVAMPPRRIKKWTDSEITQAIEPSFDNVFDRLLGLEFRDNGTGDPEPIVVTLSAQAKDAWVAFFNEHAAEYAELVGDLSAAWAKLEGYAARFALILHLVRWAANDRELIDPCTVDAESVKAGALLSGWFGGEARRVYAVLGESGAERDRRRLVEWIERRGGVVTARELQQGHRRFRTAEDAEVALRALEKRSWVFGRLFPRLTGAEGRQDDFGLHNRLQSTEPEHRGKPWFR